MPSGEFNLNFNGDWGGGCKARTVTPPLLNIVSDDGWIVFSIIQHKKNSLTYSDKVILIVQSDSIM